MTLAETFKLMAMIDFLYPKFKVNYAVEEHKECVKLWHEMLYDLDFQVLKQALKSHQLESHYPPQISDLRKLALKNQLPESNISGTEAWGMVLEAVRKYGYYQEDAALESLPPLVRMVTKAMGFQAICKTDEVTLGVERGQFLKMYESQKQKEISWALMPADLQAEIKQMQGREPEELKPVNIKLLGAGCKQGVSSMREIIGG